MARPRSKPFKGGDKFVVYLPYNIDEKTLKLINAPKYISPKVVEILKKMANGDLVENDSKKRNSGE